MVLATDHVFTAYCGLRSSLYNGKSYLIVIKRDFIRRLPWLRELPVLLRIKLGATTAG